jgi:hypothetical protein
MNRFASTAFVLTVLAATAGCMSAPSDLDLSLTRPTVDSKFVVTLQPPAKPAAINQLHSWQVKLATPAGVPIGHARIKVDGGMPQHGHGLPTRPRVTRSLGDGVYEIEGVRFNMGGWWELKLAIAGFSGADTVTFNLDL